MRYLNWPLDIRTVLKYMDHTSYTVDESPLCCGFPIGLQGPDFSTSLGHLFGTPPNVGTFLLRVTGPQESVQWSPEELMGMLIQPSRCSREDRSRLHMGGLSLTNEPFKHLRSIPVKSPEKSGSQGLEKLAKILICHYKQLYFRPTKSDRGSSYWYQRTDFH